MLLLSSVLSDLLISQHALITQHAEGRLLPGLLVAKLIWTKVPGEQIAFKALPPCSRGQPASHGSGVPPHCAAAEHALKDLGPDVHVCQNAADAAAFAAGGGIVHPARTTCTS